MSQKIADLFDPEPIQWGFRGDPYLWSEMKTKFANVACPETEEELASMVRSAFENLTGSKINSPGSLEIERFSHGGMSSGMISKDFWRDQAIPLLCGRMEI